MSSQVSLGSTVILKDLIIESEHDYKIVDDKEKDIKNKSFSYNSPFGKAVLGAKKGEIIEVRSKAGVIKYQIIDIF